MWVTSGGLLVVLDLFELRINHIVARLCAVIGRLTFATLRLLGIHLLRQRSGSLGHGGNVGFNLGLVIALGSHCQLTNGLRDVGLVFLGSLVARLDQHLAGRMNKLIALVARTSQLFKLAVFLGIGLGVAN